MPRRKLIPVYRLYLGPVGWDRHDDTENIFPAELNGSTVFDWSLDHYLGEYGPYYKSEDINRLVWVHSGALPVETLKYRCDWPSLNDEILGKAGFMPFSIAAEEAEISREAQLRGKKVYCPLQLPTGWQRLYEQVQEYSQHLSDVVENQPFDQWERLWKEKSTDSGINYCGMKQDFEEMLDFVYLNDKINEMKQYLITKYKVINCVLHDYVLSTELPIPKINHKK